MTTVREIFAAVGLEPVGVVAWGTPPSLTTPGVYVVSRSANVDESTAPLDFKADENALRELFARRPAIAVDGEAATETSLCDRLRQMWLPSEGVLYIGLAGTSVRHRVVQYYRTPLGARSPHAGGWPIKMLSGLSELHVHFAASQDPDLSEKQMIAAFRSGVPAPLARDCCDPGNVLPYANLVDPGGRRKNHGITGAKEERHSSTPLRRERSEQQATQAPTTIRRQAETMKGRTKFSAREAAKIRSLLRQKAGADRNTQKQIRGQIRDIGFYISDFTPSSAGFLDVDFDELVSQGKVTIREAQPGPSTTTQEVED